MTQIKLSRVWFGEQETKYGTRDKCSIKCEQLKDEWLSTLKVTPKMKTWQEGDTVEVDITKKQSADGLKTFYNFTEGFSLDEVSSPKKETEKVVQIEEEDIFTF